MNDATNHPPTALPVELQQLLEQSPTAANLARAGAWLDTHAEDAQFWCSLTEKDTERLELWMGMNGKVQVGWGLSAIVCLAITLFVSTQPLQNFDRNPAVAIVLMLFFTGLVGSLVFSVLFSTLARCCNGIFGLNGASMISTKLAYVADGEVDDFYKRVDHFPAACQYLYDVKQRRRLVRHDLVVAASLVPAEGLMAANGATR